MEHHAAPALHHIGVAVRDLTAALEAWAQLGLYPSHREEVPGDRVRVAFLPFPGGRLELLEPLGDDSPVGRFLARRGEGLHHLAYQVDDIEATLASIRTQGGRLIDEAPRAGAHGSRVAFIHPATMGGVLVELVQPGPTS
jgi:methylmalonyl-CoA/ethylmalonyl-CoA epimerase